MQTIDLETLKRDGLLWQGQGQSAPQHLHEDRLWSSGWTALDDLLGGGWPRAALSEVISEAHRGLSLLLPLMQRLDQRRWLAWIGPPHVPYAPALAARGVDVSRLLLVRDVSATQGLWAAEQALKSGACAAVLAWPGEVQNAQLRRLQLAAERGDCLGILFRTPRAAVQSSPAALRLRVRSVPLGLEVEVMKRRGGWSDGSCIVPLDGDDVAVATESVAS